MKTKKIQENLLSVIVSSTRIISFLYTCIDENFRNKDRKIIILAIGKREREKTSERQSAPHRLNYPFLKQDLEVERASSFAKYLKITVEFHCPVIFLRMYNILVIYVCNIDQKPRIRYFKKSLDSRC